MTPTPPVEQPAATPLLDAQIRRVQAVNREHIASLAAVHEPAAPAPAPTAAPPAPPPASAPPPGSLEPPPVEPDPVEPDVEAIAPLPLSATETARHVDGPEASPSPAGIAIPPLIHIDPSP